MENMEIITALLKENRLQGYLLEIANICSKVNGSTPEKTEKNLHELSDKIANELVAIAKAENGDDIPEESYIHAPAAVNMLVNVIAIPCITSVRMTAKKSSIDPEKEMLNNFNLLIENGIKFMALANDKELTDEELAEAKAAFLGHDTEKIEKVFEDQEKPEEESNKGLSYDDLDEETKRIVDNYCKPKFSVEDPNNGSFFA